MKLKTTPDVGSLVLTLNEWEQYQRLAVSMLHDNVVEFDYDGNRRVVEVHAIGLSTKDQRMLVRGVQVGGEASRALPHWNLFSSAKIKNLQVGSKLHEGPREGYAMGDAQLEPVLCEIDLR